MDALKNRNRRIVELAPAAEPERFLTVLADEGLKVERLSNGRLRVESASDSLEWLFQLMRKHQLPPAEMIANPNALHEQFLKSLANGHGKQS
jgi:ABC-2 type transport system ATP-binding protein